MASSLKATKKDATPNTNVPDKYTAKWAFMLYAARDADFTVDGGPWTPVERISGPIDCNVGPVDFDFNVTICQQAKVKTNKCYLRFTPRDYAFVGALMGTAAREPLQLTIRCSVPHQFRLEGDQEAASQLPLARLCGGTLGFGYIKFMLPPRKLRSFGGRESVNMKGNLGHLKILLTCEPAPPGLRQVSAQTRRHLSRMVEVEAATAADKKQAAEMEQMQQNFGARNFQGVLRLKQAKDDAERGEPKADEAAIRTETADVELQ